MTETIYRLGNSIAAECRTIEIFALKRYSIFDDEENIQHVQ